MVTTTLLHFLKLLVKNQGEAVKESETLIVETNYNRNADVIDDNQSYIDTSRTLVDEFQFNDDGSAFISQHKLTNILG